MTAYSTANMLGANLQQIYTPNTDLYPAVGLDIPFSVGQMTVGTDGSQWTFVLASGAIAQYDFVGIDENFAAAPLTEAMADAGWIIGAAQVAIASASYGWICTKGANVSGNVLASCAADVPLYVSATAGSLDDAAGSSTYSKIDGVVCVTAKNSVAGSTEVLMTWPRSDTI